jgi:RNA polymerase sigma factor (sigma-70 family)
VIYHCIRVRVASAEDVEDLLQNFFERLLARDYHVLKLWQRGTSLPIYLAKVIRNFVVDFHRANRTRLHREVGRGGLSDLVPRGEFQGGPERDPDAPVNKTMSGAPLETEKITLAIELRELKRAGLQAWAILDPRDRFLMCGKFHRELTNEGMAERLTLTDGALRTALSRAQGRLLQGLKKLAPEFFAA